MSDSGQMADRLNRRVPIEQDVSSDETNTRAADHAADLLREGAVSVINGCQHIAQAVDERKGNKQALFEYLHRLAERGVLSQAEVEKGTRSPKLVKHRQIGTIFTGSLVDKTRDRLPSGIGPLYELTVLHNRIRQNGRNADDELIDFINNAEEPLTRKFIKEKERRLFGDAVQKERAPGIVPDMPDDGDDQPESADIGPFECVFMDTRKQMGRIRTDFHNPGTLERHLGSITLTPNGVVVVRGKVMDLGPIVDIILRALGLSAKFVRSVLLTRECKSPDIGRQEILVVASKRTVDLDDWPFSDDAKALAQMLTPNAADRLALFGEAEWEGWTNRVGDKGWAIIPDAEEA